MDWEFIVDFNAPLGAMTVLSPEDDQQLERVAEASRSVQNTRSQDPAAWKVLVTELRKGRDLAIPEHHLEEHSGLRGQLMLDLIAGKVDIGDLVSSALPNR